MAQLKEEIIRLDSSIFNRPDNNDFWKEKSKEKRVNLHHKVTHILAFLIIIPFLILIILNRPVPEYYSTIVSMVIGFYFAKNLF